MRNATKWLTALVFLGPVLGAANHAKSESPAAPKENKGVQTVVKQAIDLGPEIQGMQGRQLRMRMLTIEPGGHIGLHSHKDRPAVVYALQGTDTITSDDGKVKTLRAGDTSSADRNTTHWHQNDGKEPVVLILVDVYNTTTK
jgi:quercetin dioxygenase-like cupin family protein